jgi:uncharacterized protein YmfQ (DUF2313 family)
MAVAPSNWLGTLQALLPPGKAFNRNPDSILTRFLSAIAAMYLAAQLWLEDLLMQADPRRATTLLERWETLLGQRAAYQRLVEQGGQSRAYFMGLAELLGEPGIAITEFQRFTCNSACDAGLFGEGDVFTWRVAIPRPAQAVRYFSCNSPCDAGLQEYAPSTIECAFRERKPAHTDVVFTYTA